MGFGFEMLVVICDLISFDVVWCINSLVVERRRETSGKSEESHLLV